MTTSDNSTNPQTQPALTNRQAQFVAHLLTGLTVRDAAKSAKVSERQAHTWLKLPIVADALREARAQALSRATARAVGLMDSALSTLVDVMEEATAPSNVRVAAAKVVLDSSLRFSEVLDLAERVASLEAFRDAQQS